VNPTALKPSKTGTAQTAKVCRLLKNTCPEYIQVDSIP